MALIADLRGAVGDALVAASAGRLEASAAAELGDALLAAGVLLGEQRPGLLLAAEHYDRAARSPGGHRHVSAVLRRTSRSLARSGRAVGSRETSAALDLVAALVALTAAVAEWYEHQRRPHQAAAARAAEAQAAAVLLRQPSRGLHEGPIVTQRTASSAPAILIGHDPCSPSRVAASRRSTPAR